MGECYCAHCCSEEHDGEPTEEQLLTARRAAEADLERWRKYTAQAGLAGVSSLLRELQLAREELAQRRLTESAWRELRDRSYTITGRWDQDEVVPSRIDVHRDDGEVAGLAIDALPLLEETVRRQARAWCRQHEDSEGPELGALLSLVPERSTLEVDNSTVVDGYIAVWNAGRPDARAAHGPTHAAAIHAALLALLGDPPRGTCESCRHWEAAS